MTPSASGTVTALGLDETLFGRVAKFRTSCGQPSSTSDGD
jgi:hypothetical protein